MNLMQVESFPAAVSTEAMNYLQEAKSFNTVKAYRNDWHDFVAYCSTVSANTLPADVATVANYLARIAERRKTSTITRRVSAISQAHQMAGYESPTHDMKIRTLLAGIRRVNGTAQTGKAPILTDDIRQMVNVLPESLIGIRDRALLLLGFAGAFRRSELVSLQAEDLLFNRDGITVILRRSKTDQDAQGVKKGIPYGSCPETCPVRAVQDWMETASINEGALFRSINRHGKLQSGSLSDKAVALVVKRTAEAAGLNPEDYSGHSLRAGLATSAAIAGKSERSIMEQTGHKSVNMVRRYIRDGSLFRDNAAANIGL